MPLCARPVRAMESIMSNWVKVASDGDIPDGGCKQVELGGDAVAVFNVAGQLRAIQNSCIHRGGPLGEGYLDGDKLECPWHGWQFEVKTGCISFNRKEKIPTYFT